MEVGTIKMFLHAKGYGFIATEGPDVFFHVSGYLDDANFIEPGQQVTFDTTMDRDGRTRAFNVTSMEAQ